MTCAKHDRWVTSKPLNARASYLVSTAKTRAKKQGVPFDLTMPWILEKLEAGMCEATGLPFDFPVRPGVAGRGSFVPSLDRIVPGAGYTCDNVQLVCWIYNAAKGIGTHEHVMRMAEALCGHQKK